MRPNPIDRTLTNLMAAAALSKEALSVLWVAASLATGKTGGAVR